MIKEDQIEQDDFRYLGDPRVLQPDGWVSACETDVFFARNDNDLVGQKMTPSCFTYRPVWSFKKSIEIEDPPNLTHLYSVLWSFSNLDWIAWPSIEDIIERGGLPESFVVNGMNALEFQQLIRVHVGLLNEGRFVIDFADRDKGDMRILLMDVPRRMRPNLMRVNRH